MEATRDQRKAKASTTPPASPRRRPRLHKQKAAHQANWQLQTLPPRMQVTRRASGLGIISTRLHTSPHHQSRHAQLLNPEDLPQAFRYGPVLGSTGIRPAFWVHTVNSEEKPVYVRKTCICGNNSETLAYSMNLDLIIIPFDYDSLVSNCC
jgi:hypothetical protein